MYMDFKYVLPKSGWKTIPAKLSKIDFPLQPDGTYVITHTFVDDSLRGQGVAGKIVQAAADYIRGQGRKAAVTCSYASAWAKRHKEYDDIFTD